MTPPLRKRLLSPTEGPRPRRPPTPPPPEPEPGSSWTDAKVNAVLEGFRSSVQNAARKHGVDPSEVSSLVRDYLCDPDAGG
jgi:hypothetical protein